MNLTEPKATRMNQSMNIRSLCCIIGMAALLAACSDPEPPREPAEIVAERAQARWDALVERDYRTAWQYFSPAYRETLEDFDYATEMARRPVRWTSAEVHNVECDPERSRCVVQTRLEYSIPGMLPGVGSMQTRSGAEEIWLQIGEEWWYHQGS